MIGESVTATTPEMITATARVNVNSRNNAPLRPAHEADRRVYGREREGHRDDRCEELSRADQGGLNASLTGSYVPGDVLYDDNRIVDDQPHGQDDREDGQQVEREAQDQDDRDSRQGSKSGS